MRLWRIGLLSELGPVLLLLALAIPKGAEAQTSTEVRDRLMGHFDIQMSKFIALAEAMPEDTYTWSPGDGVMETGQVFMHVARYNYLYSTQNLGFSLPGGVDMESMEVVRDKEQVLAALAESREWARGMVGAMRAQELEEETELYGRTMEKWAVLTQLVSHMSEHLGQSIAYARMNGVAPPWSR
jgi:uncharacterized damage-inducible protein DinB